MVSILENNSDIQLPDCDYVDQREQEVHAHVGSVSFKGLEEPILLSQDLSGGCGGKVWECANIIIDYFVWKNEQTKGDIFRNKRIVELGAGTGLVGLALAKLCPEIKQLTMTDQTPMMSLMEQNIALNNVGHIVNAEILNWGEDVSESLSNIDVVVASDCVYLEVAFIPLIETFFSLSHKEDSVIYLMYRKRRSADKRFFQMARKKFDIQDIMDDPKREEYVRNGFRLFKVKRKAIKQQVGSKKQSSSSIQEN